MWLASALGAALALGSSACERRRVVRDRDAPELSADAGANADASFDNASQRPTPRVPRIPGCVDPPLEFAIVADPIGSVDVLFVVDDSSSMQPVQAGLRVAFPKLIDALSNAVVEFEKPVRSVHFGIVSADLGLRGADPVPGCSEAGSDGVFRLELSDVQGCRPQIPDFIAFNPASGGLTNPFVDIECVADLGTEGCGVQQPLEAALRALLPAAGLEDPLPGGPGSGHADSSNAGFLRPAQGSSRSLLAIMVVTDKDDCSLADAAGFVTAAGLAGEDRERIAQLAGAQCPQHSDRLLPLERYLEAFTQLRPQREHMLIFGALAGVPLSTDERQSRIAVDDHAGREAFFDQVLADPAMQVRVDDRGTRATDDDRPAAACDGSNVRATPARRLVEIARRIGTNAAVHSVCAADYTEPMFTLARKIKPLLGDPCLTHPLHRGSNGLLPCEVVWSLPREGAAADGTPVECGDERFPFLRLLDEPGSERTRCLLPQLRVSEQDGVLTPVATESDGERFEQGWYYDDFSGDTGRLCPQLPRRVAFSPGAQPPQGVRVTLRCEPSAHGDMTDGCGLGR